METKQTTVAGLCTSLRVVEIGTIGPVLCAIDPRRLVREKRDFLSRDTCVLQCIRFLVS